MTDRIGGMADGHYSFGASFGRGNRASEHYLLEALHHDPFFLRVWGIDSTEAAIGRTRGMRVKAAEFDTLCTGHRESLEAAGWEVVRQLRYRRGFLRRWLRAVSRSELEVWRTYWEVRGRDGTRGFAKVYLGYDTSEKTVRMGRKEADLIRYFSEMPSGGDQLEVPELLYDAPCEPGYAVVSTWRTLTPVSLEEMMASPRSRSRLTGLLSALRTVSPPSWWTAEHLEQDYARTKELGPDGWETPFDFDIDRNLCVTDTGKLYFHDFEKLQWSLRGLQECVVALRVLCECSESKAASGARRDFIHGLMSSLPRAALVAALPAAEKSYRATVSRLEVPLADPERAIGAARERLDAIIEGRG